MESKYSIISFRVAIGYTLLGLGTAKFVFVKVFDKANLSPNC